MNRLEMNKKISIQQKTKQELGYVPLNQGSSELYSELGFRCGLEVHQQLQTDRKLFCRCHAGRYQHFDDYDAEILRHMRPTLSELGEYDGTALMEFKTRKNIIYRIKNESACTYEMDDTPPFPINRDALDIAIQIALQMRTNVVGELHITRKQYLDGSIPTGFQRTAIVGINGSIPLKSKLVNVIQLSIEEDSCREVSDVGHDRIYTTDRLGMPLIETVTAPELLSPHEAAEGAQVIRLITRSSGRVRTGIGATREDVNVSICGGTRVEIKGVARIAWIPQLTHNEAFRQKALLSIRNTLKTRIKKPRDWSLQSVELDCNELRSLFDTPPSTLQGEGISARLLRLPHFADLLPFFTSPGRVFADEISDRLKVIAALERPNMDYQGNENSLLSPPGWQTLQSKIEANNDDALMILWGPENDMSMALETVSERCQLAFEGVPSETRQPRADGTTRFERVLPGPDRMYPDTDSAPIAIEDSWVRELTGKLPPFMEESMAQMAEWAFPADCIHTIHRLAAFPVVEKIQQSFHPIKPRQIATLIGHRYKHLSGRLHVRLSPEQFYHLYDLVMGEGLHPDILPGLLKELCHQPRLSGKELLKKIAFAPRNIEQLKQKLQQIISSLTEPQAAPKRRRFLAMRAFCPLAQGNISRFSAWEMIKEQIHD